MVNIPKSARKLGQPFPLESGAKKLVTLYEKYL